MKDARVDHMEETLNSLGQKVERRFDSTDEQCHRVDGRFDGMDERFDRLERLIKER
ncbi:MAG: hypothetical protein HQ485_12345 [Acidobacteria bacterium]|jgi:hypothetical protein|nr:hypothetical protein [Acidobacteriota bacterium]